MSSIELLTYFLLAIVLLGMVPIVTLLAQFFIAGLHGIYNPYSNCEPYTPNVAILIPAWNEADVIGYSIDKLIKVDYPLESLRIFILDDGSEDNTYEVVHSKMAEYPNNVFYLRNEVGGKGKANVINFGLKHVLANDWAQTIMITDADVIYEKNILLKLTRHFVDPKIGAATAYIRVAQKPGNFLTHSISAEYILSQAIARRAQNVMGCLACLAGGAQMHSRENIELLGGQINTDTLAEDTYTTFLTQLNHKSAIYEGHSVVDANEPDDLLALWKQRFRWGRGNVQITRAFKDVWFQRKNTSGLGGIFFGLTWFSTLFMPITMITTSISLIILYFINAGLSWEIFRFFYMISAASYIFSSLLSFSIDSGTMQRAWFACLLFPGIVSLTMIAISIYPRLIGFVINPNDSLFNWQGGLLLFMYAWISLCMVCAWIVYRIAKLRVFPEKFIQFLLSIVGYGPLLCAITLMAIIAEFRKSTTVWDKTEKKLHVDNRKPTPYRYLTFEQTLEKDVKAEHKFLLDEILILIFIFTFFTFIHYIL
jgi:cellulose synthase/poly-beta-1,6-N-acetylglucosamine synthase-like glycosyltransferase